MKILSKCQSARSGELYIGGAGVARGYRKPPRLNCRKNSFPIHFSSNPRKRGCIGPAILDPTSKMARSLFCRGEPTISLRSGGIGWRQMKLSRCSAGILRCSPAWWWPREDENREQISGGLRRLRTWNTSSPPRSCESSCAHSCRNIWFPAIFVRLEKLPLSPHGKVDRQALPVS